MQNTLRATAIVQAGGKIQVNMPQLAEGVEVNVLVVPSPNRDKPVMGIADFLESLPPSKLTESEWKRRDEEFEQDRAEWDR